MAFSIYQEEVAPEYSYFLVPAEDGALRYSCSAASPKKGSYNQFVYLKHNNYRISAKN